MSIFKELVNNEIELQNNLQVCINMIKKTNKLIELCHHLPHKATIKYQITFDKGVTEISGDYTSNLYMVSVSVKLSTNEYEVLDDIDNNTYTIADPKEAANKFLELLEKHY